VDAKVHIFGLAGTVTLLLSDILADTCK
jgi:hypothetical protein